MKLHKELIKGSAVLLIGFGIFNFIHFLFQLLLARLLSVEEYGLLASVFVIVYISSVFSESIQNFMVKYAAGEQDGGKIKNLIKRITKKITKICFIIIGIYLIAIIALSKLLDIDYGLLALAGFLLVLALFLPVTRGVMQGKKRFHSLSVNMIIEALVKLGIGVGLVYLGFGVIGALVGVIFAGIIGFILSIYQLKDIVRSEEKSIDIRNSYSYAWPTFCLTAVIVLFYSLDVWVARIFFSHNISGSYAIASLLGKILFWGTLPISKAMLPMTSDLAQDRPKNVFRTSLLLVTLAVFAASALFYLFPGEIINIFSGGKEVSEAVKILFYEGLSFGIIALSNLFLLYNLSINKTKKYWIMIVPLILELVILSFFTDTLTQFSIAFLFSSVLFFIFSIIFVYLNKTQEKI